MSPVSVNRRPSAIPAARSAARQFLSLSALTALETVRQPICLLLTTACVALTALVPVLLLHHFGEEGKLARDSGLAFQFVFGLLIAVQAAGSSLAREIRSGTASAVLSKPVSRPLFFLAKFAGVAGVIVAFSLCATLATLLAERVSEKFDLTQATPYLTDWKTGFLLLAAPAAAYAVAALLNCVVRRPFGSSAFAMLVICLLSVFLFAAFHDRAGGLAPFDPRVQWRIVPAAGLITLALVVLSALTLALSVRLSPVPVLLICGGAFLAGMMSDYFFGPAAGRSPVAAVLYHLLPNWQHFWVADALDRGGTIPLNCVARCALYAALYASGLLCLGIAAFRCADLR